MQLININFNYLIENSPNVREPVLRIKVQYNNNNIKNRIEFTVQNKATGIRLRLPLTEYTFIQMD